MKRAYYFKIAAAFILGLTAIFWMIKGFIDVFSGVKGGILNLALSIIMVFLIFLCWKRPLLGGIIAAALAIIMAIYFNLTLPNIFIAFIPMLLMCAPMVISGLLFIEADWATRKSS